MMARIASLVFVVLLIATPVAAREIAGIDIPEKITQIDGTELQLNGAGIRSKFFFKIYIAELFLENTNSDVNQLLKNDGGRRMVLHFIYDEVEKADLVEAWNEGFQDNGTEKQLNELSGQVEAFNAMFDTVREGDQVVLDYIPETGTTVTIRGEQKGMIKGKAFNDLLLAIWLGKEPVTEDLRDELLGK